MTRSFKSILFLFHLLLLQNGESYLTPDEFMFQLPIIQDIQKLDAKHPVVEMFMDEVFNTVENLDLLCEVIPEESICTNTLPKMKIVYQTYKHPNPKSGRNFMKLW